MAKNAATVQERVKLLLANDPKKDKAARFLWPFLSSLWNFAAERIGEAANDAPSIDQAMRAGFNWELGPFELWDAAGVRESVARMRTLGIPVTAAVKGLLESAPESAPVSWYSPDGPQCYNPITGEWETIPQQPGHARVADFRRRQWRGQEQSRRIAGGHRRWDWLHRAARVKNAIGGDVVAMISSVLNPASEAVKNFRGFVISGDRDRFSVGANLMQLLLGAQEGDWDEVEMAIRAFQQMSASIKFCPRPVVVAPFNLTLGGGAEICLHATRRQMHAETYIGLVETGIGLIPGRRWYQGNAAAGG